MNPEVAGEEYEVAAQFLTRLNKVLILNLT